MFKNKYRKIITAVLCCALILGIALNFNGANTAQAAISLPAIEEIKSNEEFNILEIAPDANVGSIGWYVDGSEPSKNAMEAVGTKVGATSRETAVAELLKMLKQANLLSADDSTPLKSVDAYGEVYPWDSVVGPKYRTLDIATAETAQKSVEMIVNPDVGLNDYMVNPQYDLVTENGTHKENITGFLNNELDSDVTEGYYYKLEMKELVFNIVEGNTDADSDGTNAVIEPNAVIYEAGTDIDAPDFTTLKLVGYAGSNLGLERGKTYWQAVPDIANPATSPQTDYYRATVDGYTEDTAGKIALVENNYTYVGAGHVDATHSIVAGGTTTKEVTFSTNQVFYTGGYTNNNWFVRHVFDWENTDGSMPKVTVTTVAPDAVSDVLVNSNDMIVLSNGYRYDTSTSVPTWTDISDGMKDAIEAKVNAKTPILIDSAVGSVSGTPYLNELVSDLGADKDISFVSKNIYSFKGETKLISGTLTSLVTTDFFEPLAASEYKINAPYYSVHEEIEEENFLRGTASVSALPADVSMAHAIRSIINYNNYRKLVVKDEIRVLAIEPMTTTDLTKEDIMKFIGNTLEADDIKIDVMSTAEFIGKIDDIVEVYDMVYIGGDTRGMNMDSGNTVYNDTSMNGLIYTNIGDIYRVTHFKQVGLLDRDYYASDTFVAGSETYNYIKDDRSVNQFRFSGNDITEKKMKELTEFADAGYPIIISDKLMNGDRANPVTVDVNSYVSELIEEISDKDNVLTATEAKTDASIVKYLNLSKPEIVFSTGGIPPVYKYDVNGSTGITGVIVDGETQYEMEYKFTIKNDADPTPEQTRYNIKLYIDSNADGVYSADEEMSDAVVTQTSDSNVVASDNLQNNIEYTMSTFLPPQIIGILPWKLQVVKEDEGTTDNSYIRNSQQNFSYVKPDRDDIVELDVLQINSSAIDQNNINLSEDEGFQKILNDDKQVTSDFDVTIKTISASEFNRESDQFDYLDDFDMIIIGFSDVYGELGGDAAAAIQTYIDTGRATLFSHDNTSFVNLPIQGYKKLKKGNGGTSETDKKEWTNHNNGTFSGTVSMDTPLTFNKERMNVEVRNDVTVYGGVLNTLTFDIDTTEQTSAGTTGIGIYKQGQLSITQSPEELEAAFYVANDDTENFRDYVTLSTSSLTGGTNWGKIEIIIEKNFSGRVILPFTPIEDYTSTKLYVWEPEIGVTISNMELVTNGERATSITYNHHWGYYFNASIRNSVGLDRYGITDDTLGRTKYSPLALKGGESGPVANDYDFADSRQNVVGGTTEAYDVDDILADGYSIAYAPKDDGNTTIETHGYTNLALLNTGKNATNGTMLKPFKIGNDGLHTTSVSQVNQGQITSYPFDINTDAFKQDDRKKDNLIKVARTHDQYYQLNMNSDDIVVWYTLAADDATKNSYYDNQPNDVTNSYYIYSKGNVTYTGYGDFYSDTTTDDERKLFVNTMIAAYRVASVPPEVQFVDANTEDAMDDFFFFADTDGILVDLQNDLGALNFNVTDKNLGQKEVDVTFYRAEMTSDKGAGLIDMPDEMKAVVGDEDEDVKVKEMSVNSSYKAVIYDVQTGKEVTGSLQSGLDYMVKLPTKFLTEFKDEADSSVELYIVVETKVNGVSIGKAMDTVIMRKIGLFELD